MKPSAPGSASARPARPDWLRVRDMTLDDIPAVDAIEKVLYPFPWSPGNFRDSIASGYRCMIFIAPDATIGAYAIAMLALDECHLLNISVRSDLQHQGRGADVLHRMAQLAQADGAASMLLEVRPTNTVAARLYAAAGFVSVGRRKGYYPDHGGGREDAIVMWCALPLPSDR